MPEIHETPVHRVIYYPGINLIKHVFNAKANGITWLELQSAFRTYVEFLKLHKPQLVLVDTSLFNFVFLKDMQDWVTANVVSVLREIDIKKWASIVSPQFFSQVSIEQTMESNKTYEFETRYFDKEEDALEWLLSNHNNPQELEQIMNG